MFTLLAGMMLFPLNVGSSMVTGSLKSGSHPTDGQSSGWFFGTTQNFVNIASNEISLSHPIPTSRSSRQ
jgi:hypothetical protein